MKYELTVCDHGRPFILDYQNLLAFHGGSAIAGATAGFRVVQAAAIELEGCGRRLERESIQVISGHPGPGYRDAFEYTLRCVSRNRFTLDRTLSEAQYSPFHDYAFQFLFVEQAIAKQVTVTLRDGILPDRFFVVLRGLKRKKDDVDLHRELDDLKKAIAQRALKTSLHQLFATRVDSI